jgi:hypothetical protein
MATRLDYYSALCDNHAVEILDLFDNVDLAESFFVGNLVPAWVVRRRVLEFCECSFSCVPGGRIEAKASGLLGAGNFVALETYKFWI